MNVGAVLFDAVGTLIRPEPPVAAAYAAAAARYGSQLTESEVLGRFRAAFARQESLDASTFGQQTSEGGERSRWQTIVTEVFDDVSDGEALFAALWQHFAEPCHWRLFDDAAAAWPRLAACGLTLGVASNFDARLEGICRALEPLDDCRHVFMSSRLGWRKPAAEFFRAIEQSLALPAQRLLLVGDDDDRDYQAALAAGWQAVLVDREQRRDEVRRVSHLSELPDLLD